MNVYTLNIHALNALGVLPRILMAISRRRLPVREMHMVDPEQRGEAYIQITLDCAADSAEQLSKQLRKIIELKEVFISAGPLTQSQALVLENAG
jgi:acetolactate synthase regulatory subunit